MDQFQYLSLSASPREDGVSMPPLSPISPVLKHEHIDPFAFDWNVSVKREVSAPSATPVLPSNTSTHSLPNDVPDADAAAPGASLAHLFNTFSVPSTGGNKSIDLSSVDGTSSDGWAQLASLPLKPATMVQSVRFAPNAVSLPRFTFDMSSAPVPDSSSAPSSPVSRRGSVASTAANSRAASPSSPWSTASDENDEDDGSSAVSSWSPSSTASSPSSIRSSLSAFRQRAASISSSAAEDEVVDCDASPDADDTTSLSSGSLSPLADAANVVAPLLMPRKQPSSAPSSPVLQPAKPVRKSVSLSSVASTSSTSSTEEVKRPRKPLVGPTGLPLTPMCSPSACDTIAAAAAGKTNLREVGRWNVHFVPDCDNPRPPKAKATPLNIVLAPPSSSSSLVPVRIRLRPQAPRSFRNVVKTARTYNVMHGVAPPADASDKDPAHFLYFSITAVDSSTKLAGPQAAHVAGRGQTTSGDRTRRQAKFKHADDKKEYQGHVQLDLSQPGEGARLEIRLFAAPSHTSPTLPRFHVVTGQCDHKFAHMYVSDMNTVSRV